MAGRGRGGIPPAANPKAPAPVGIGRRVPSRNEPPAAAGSRSVSSPKPNTSQNDDEGDEKASTKKKAPVPCDFGTLTLLLRHHPGLDALAAKYGVEPELLRSDLVDTLASGTSVGFSNASRKHLEPLRTEGRLLWKAGEKDRLKILGDGILTPYTTSRQRCRASVWVRSEAGCRMMIDQIAVPAVWAAGERQLLEPIVINELGEPEGRTSRVTDRLVIAPELLVDGAAFGEIKGAMSYNGPIDYTVVLVDEYDYADYMRAMSTIAPPPNRQILAIIEAKTPASMDKAQWQIEAQCFTLLKETSVEVSPALCVVAYLPSFSGRAFFAGALTNGSYWIFYMAQGSEKGYSIWRSPSLTSPDEDGVIVGTLVELIRSPGRLPTCFFCDDRKKPEKP